MNYGNLLLYPATIFCPENVACFLHLLHVFKCISDYICSWKQTIWTLIRLPWEQSDLGPYYLQYKLS